MGWEMLALPASNFGGSVFDMYTAKRSQDRAENMNNKNIEMQREFAQNGIRWRVEDAQAAGLHPLAALGASGASFSPVTAVGETYFPGRDLAQMGQNISRAMEAGMTDEELTHKRLLNALLVSQIEETDQRKRYMEQQMFDSFMSRYGSKGVPGTGSVQTIPDKQISRSSKDSSVTAGYHPAWKSFEVLPGVNVDLLQSDEGPAESMEGAGALALTAARNLIYRPSKFLERALDKALNGYRGYMWKHQQQYRKKDNLVSKPTSGR